MKRTFKVCIQCNKEFECYNKIGNHNRLTRVKRGLNCVTCSKKCSRIYTRKRQGSYHRRKRLKNKKINI